MAKHESLRAWILLILSPNQNAGFGIVAVQPLSHIQPFVTPWTTAYQAPSSVHGIFQATVLEWDA